MAQDWIASVRRGYDPVALYGQITHRHREFVSIALMTDGRLVLSIGGPRGTLMRRDLGEGDEVLAAMARGFLDDDRAYLPLIDWMCDAEEFAAAMRGEGEVLQSRGPMLGNAE